METWKKGPLVKGYCYKVPIVEPFDPDAER